MDRDLARDPRVRAAVERALLRPCETLTPPKGLPYARWPSAIGKPAWASWNLLRCDRRRQVTGSAVTLDEGRSQTLVRLTFALTPER